MKQEIQHFNSLEVAQILGVNVSTIKRWTEAGKLKCFKTAGGHRKFLIKHLAQYIKTHKTKNKAINLFPLEDETDLLIGYRILKSDYDFLIDHVVKHALECRHEKVQQVLNGLYLGGYPLYEIYDCLLTPVLYRLGNLWQQNKLSIIEEHFGSQTIRDSLIRLQGIIPIPDSKTGRVICLNLSEELHDIALKMTANILELRGFQVYFSGQYTHILQIERVFTKLHPQRVYISLTWIEDLEKTRLDLQTILQQCELYNTELFLGGQGAELLNLHHHKGVRVLKNFKEAHCY